MIDQFVCQSEGILIHKDKDHFIASFKAPGKAVQCSLDLLDSLQDLKTSFNMGLYIKEMYTDHKNSLNKRDQYIMSAMRSQLKQNKILVTQAIKYLLSGSDFNFDEDSSILDYSSHELCKLFSVSKKLNSDHTVLSKKYRLSQYNSFLEDVMQVIEEHLDNNTFTVDLLSKEMGVSERQLQRKLKEATGKSPTQLITSIRLHKAKSALLFRNYTIAEIAFQFGFSSPSYFSKCFKKEFGISPNEIFNTQS